MTLTEHEQLNTVAPWYDVQLRYFAGPNFGMMAKDGLRAILTPWTSPDNPLANWTEITDRVAYASTFNQTLQGSSIVWTADLAGWNYDDDLLGLGLTLVCWRRCWRPTGTGSAPAGWQAWQIAYVGEIISRADRNNYQNGKAWQRMVTGLNFHLAGINAPRVTAGKMRVAVGGSVTGNAPLEPVEAERDTGEFVGGRASVNLTNVTDGNRNTVYISDTIPAGAAVGFPSPVWDGGSRPSEVFIKPFAGWPLERAWWIEVYNQRANDSQAKIPFQVATYSGGSYVYYPIGEGDAWPKLSQGRCGIFCAHRKTFDELTGGDNNGAEWIVDVSQFGVAHLTDDAAVYVGNEVIAWAPGGASRDYVFRHKYGTSKNNGTLNSSLLSEGQSFLNSFGGGWAVNPYPHPGANGTGEGPVWLKVLLPDNICNTLDEVSAVSTTIRLDNYLGWLVPPTASYGRGSILSKVFRWTSRDANGLHGVTWESAPATPIPAGTRCYPYANGNPQTGYPITMAHLIRRKQPAIQAYRLYLSQYDADDYTEPGWRGDYYDLHHIVQGNSQFLNLANICSDGANGYLWVRSLLYLIDRMTDGGRAKVNEIEVDLAQTALDLAGTAALDGRNSSALARYLVNEWAGVGADDFVDESAGGAHLMGQHALAITPVDRVLDDLARGTGCLVDYAPAGGVVWREDPWWPKNSAAPETVWAFDGNSYRGDALIQQEPAQVDYVILNAVSLEGDPHSLRVVYPTPLGTTEPPVWALAREVNDRIVALDADASAVAQVELEKLTLSSRGARLTVKGPGEWARPGLRVGLYHDYTGRGTWDENLLSNGGFETHTGTVDDNVSDAFAGWEVVGVNDGAGNRAQATATRKSGATAIKLTYTSDIPYISQVVNVAAGATYRLTAEMMGNGQVVIYQVLPSSNYLLGQNLTGGVGRFKRVELLFTAPANATRIQIILAPRYEPATVHFDDVTLQAVTGAQYRTWLIQSATTTLGENGGQRTQQTDLELVAFRG